MPLISINPIATIVFGVAGMILGLVGLRMASKVVANSQAGVVAVVICVIALLMGAVGACLGADALLHQ
jgi:hypothetical protein